ncbi:GNAT family N-acetyltransferase [Dongia rigui]|uniref:GNAT family N-acetyltransferase n=1 Tax=Dongia rigui TaxID=940149 RepID=A0ABU5DW92_9PROT|nr:GNAT family N-acetyltransferase [Dongia rigui]MDY0871577.1 GNAT family N-acetyltransferase [Dongia rigui]
MTQIRPTTAADLTTIAEIHLKGWELAYGAFLPADQLAAMQPAKRLPLWQAWLSDPKKLILVGSIGDEIDGFLLGGPVKDHDIRKGSTDGFDCEIYSLHCRAHVQGKGLGRALISAAATHWSAAGKHALMLWAYSDNAYRKFYEKIGGHLIAEGIDDGIPDVAYGWRSLADLSAIRHRLEIA